MRNATPTLLLALPLLLVACRLVPKDEGADSLAPAGGPAAPARGSDTALIERVLDDFHAAASEADGERYFAHMTEDGVFHGTDATERWTKAEFQEYAAPHFGAGRGWTYAAVERHVFVGPSMDVAWFDERLRNEKYGECRGTGALRREDGAWRIAQYNLTIPIPNELAAEFVERIRSLDDGAR
jgi:ketosteroid isomerase-like protein